MKQIYTVEVAFRRIKAPNQNITIPAGNVGVDFIKFVGLGNDWDSLIKTAVFISDNCTEKVLLDSDNCAEVPCSMLKEKGIFSFGLWGSQVAESNDVELRYSTNLQTGVVGDGAYDERAETAKKQQATEYERILNHINAHVSDKENPHGVTPEQIGTYDRETIDQKIEKGDNAYEELLRHLLDANNPHNITAEQVGAYDKDTIDMYQYNNRKYVDEKVGDISSALAEIIALENHYIDGGAV